jgi:hypothetical protein
LCADVKALGAALLAALEKKDAEALAALRGSHEVQALEATRAVKEQQIAEAAASLASVPRQYSDRAFRDRACTSLGLRRRFGLLTLTTRLHKEICRCRSPRPARRIVRTLVGRQRGPMAYGGNELQSVRSSVRSKG